jgi:hypothetical protein
MIFRQYSLHRLFVLSIYHPARGFDLFANNFASNERAELLISARATLKLQSEDKGIWSNWDLVVFTPFFHFHFSYENEDRCEVLSWMELT